MNNKQQIDLEQYKPCVYYLYFGNLLVYIGSTKHIGYRLYNHSRNGLVYNRVSIFICKDMVEALQNEKRLIEKYNPPYNRSTLSSRKFNEKINKNINFLLDKAMKRNTQKHLMKLKKL